MNLTYPALHIGQVLLYRTLNMKLAGLIEIIEGYFTLFYTYSCATEAMLPAYLHESTKLSLPLPPQAWQSGNYTDPVPVNNTTVWPTATELGLNDSQYAAYKAALTQDFSVIQGYCVQSSFV